MGRTQIHLIPELESIFIKIISNKTNLKTQSIYSFHLILMESQQCNYHCAFPQMMQMKLRTFCDNVQHCKRTACARVWGLVSDFRGCALWWATLYLSKLTCTQQSGRAKSLAREQPLELVGTRYRLQVLLLQIQCSSAPPNLN